jgi:hypothetical protein
MPIRDGHDKRLLKDEMRSTRVRHAIIPTIIVTAPYCPSVFNGDEHDRADAGTKHSAGPSHAQGAFAGFDTRPSGQSGPLTRQLQPGDGLAEGGDIVWQGGGRLAGPELILSAYLVSEQVQHDSVRAALGEHSHYIT